MSKAIYLISIIKILIISMVLVCSIQFSGLIGKARTTAFFSSSFTAAANPLITGDWTPPDHPLFWVEEDTEEVKISWLLNPDIHTYRIYRSLNDIDYINLGTAANDSNFFIDHDVVMGSHYYYKVTGVDAADNETDMAVFRGKKASPKHIVIDDHAHGVDHNDSGTTSLTGTWGAYHTYQAGYPAFVLQNAVGGDNFSTTQSSGQIFSWTTTAQLNGEYDLFVQYICDSSRGVARYDVFADGSKLNSTPVEIYQNRTDGQATSPVCGSQTSSSTTGADWVKVGTYSFFNQTARITLTAQAGERNILADAVAFTYKGDAQLDIPVNKGWNLRTESAVPYEDPPDLQCGEVTNGGNPSAPLVAHYWSVVNGGGVRYQREITRPSGAVSRNYYETNSYIPFSALGSVAGIEGLWKFRVRAFIDKNGDSQATEGVDIISAWSNYCDITLDKTAPTTTALVENSPIKPMEQRIINGDFEQGSLTGWQKGSDSQVRVISGDEYLASPHQGRFMAKIGTDIEGEGQPVTVNLLSQTIPAGVRSIGFYYNFFTTDTAPFDNPGMMVFVNNKQVQQIWAEDINVTDDDSGRAYSSGWRHMNVYVGDEAGGTLTIAFYAGNQGEDLDRQSWVYIDEVSTLDLVVNQQARFQLQVDSPGAVTYYQIGQQDPVAGNEFSLGANPYEGVIKYWSRDAAGNVEPEHVFWVANDNKPPATIADLKAIDDGDGEYSLQFTAPSDDLFTAVSEYDVRYAQQPITAETDWSSLSTPARIETTAPRTAGQPDRIKLNGLTADSHYFFAVKSSDAARNWSGISNIAEVNGLPTVALQQQDSHRVKLKLINIEKFIKAEYAIMYAHEIDGESIEEAMTDAVDILDQPSLELHDLYLGTCSEEGLVCVPHQQISHLEATVTLTRPDSTTLQLEYVYPHAWIEETTE